MPLHRHQGLRAVAAAVIAATGSDEREAALVADHLVDANLAGHDSHGVGMLPTYVDEVLGGRMRPNTPATLVRDNGGTLAFDGERGYGQRVAGEAMAGALARTAEIGTCLLTLRNAGHIGRVGAYGEQAVRAGALALIFVNVTDHGPSVAPHGSREARYATNPVCIAVPDGSGGAAVLLDMATSAVAFGKVRVARNEGRRLDQGLVLDGAGAPTTDPEAMFVGPRGVLLPFGGHKGSGLALACELLAGVMSGNGTLQPGNARRGGIVNNLFALLADPGRLVDDGWWREEVAATLDYVRSAAPREGAQVQVAGDPEARRREQRLREGIVVDDTTWEEILVAAARVGVPAAGIDGLLQGT